MCKGRPERGKEIEGQEPSCVFVSFACSAGGVRCFRGLKHGNNALASFCGGRVFKEVRVSEYHKDVAVEF
jgi:hypothetical protein